MAITVEWDNPEQTVLRLTFFGSWNCDELHRAVDIAEAMAAECSNPVDAIVDMTNAESLPTGSLLDPAFRANAQLLARRATGRHGRIVVAGASPWLASVYQMFRGLLGERVGRVAFSQDIAEAVHWLGLSQEPAPLQPTPAEAA